MRYGDERMSDPRMKHSTLVPEPVAIDYPTENGVPLAETDARGIPLSADSRAPAPRSNAGIRIAER